MPVGVKGVGLFYGVKESGHYFKCLSAEKPFSHNLAVDLQAVSFCAE